jgi:hypothetical protein
VGAAIVPEGEVSSSPTPVSVPIGNVKYNDPTFAATN